MKQSIMREWVIPFMISAAIVLVIHGFLYAPFKVRGLSMYPALKGNEFILVNKWKYRIDEPKYGEIVVFHADKGRDFIKRVEGVAGDKIAIKNGNVYRNGILIDEPYIDQPTYAHEDREVVVSPGKIYVLGDNRGDSLDSRRLGEIDKDKVVGRADVALFPFSNIHCMY